MTIELNSYLVGVLRDRTQLPLMKCKKALTETKGDYSDQEPWLVAAVEWLRKNGEDAVNRMAGRDTPCGRIGVHYSGSVGVMVKFGCQTDFVANSDEFKTLVTQSIQILAYGSPNKTPVEDIMELIKNAIAKLGENIVQSKMTYWSLNEGELVTGYNHDGRIGVLVRGYGPVEKLRQVALHIAAANPEPLSLDESGIPVSMVEKEKEIIKAMPDMIGKSDVIAERMIVGKMKRFYKERTLLHQEMLLDALPKETVAQYINRNELKVNDFVKYSI